MLKCYSHWFNAFDEGWATVWDSTGKVIGDRQNLTAINR